MTGNRIRARVFGEVADRYERVRPSYPAALVDDVLAHAGPAAGTALEVGAGTGKATVAFAGRGLGLTAVEPDPAMADVLRQRLAGRPGVTVVVSAFEDLPARGQRYGLLYSAQAWHWTDRETRWRRAAGLLAPGGTLALFWNDDRIADAGIRAAVLAAHREHAPHIPLDDDPVTEDTVASHWPGPELAEQPSFTDQSQRLYGWERSLTIQDYAAYLSTQSAYRMLDEPVRARLFDDIATVATNVRMTVQTVLYLARRA